MGYEIILSDDASTDGTATWLRTLRDFRIRVLTSDTNRGYAANNNAGVEIAKGELLGLLNNDLLFEPGWLEPMLAILLTPELRAGLVGNVQQRVSDFAVLDGFDEVFFNGCEDIDLCFKVRASGKNIYLASESRIRHHVSLSRKTNTLQDLRNSRLLFSRWRPEIKRELSGVWHSLIVAGPHAYKEKLNGELSSEFLETPYAASLVIAESMLRREESHWSSQLDKAEVGFDVMLKTQSLRYSAEHGAHLLQNSGAFSIDGLQYVRKLTFYGRRLDDLRQPVTLTIRVNGLQIFRIPLRAERNVNVGLSNPLLLSGIVNTFQLETTQALLLTHLVIDDKVVDL